jgi:CheY-like chemotaxis protein
MSSLEARVLLLIEDNSGDARLVADLLEGPPADDYKIIHVTRVLEGVRALRSAAVDVIVLDLRLPDSDGIDTVRIVREIAAQTPIVVLTGNNDEALALACLDAGAHDYLRKDDLRPQNLRRAIGYAITRVREAQLRDLEATLNRYRDLSSATQTTTVTASLAGSGAILARSPASFREVVDAYFRLIEPYLNREDDCVDPGGTMKEGIVTMLGDFGGGPRDLIDVHLAALERALAGRDDAHTRSVVAGSRVLALEMMGLLVDYYRVGQRRTFSGGAKT